MNPSLEKQYAAVMVDRSFLERLEIEVTNEELSSCTRQELLTRINDHLWTSSLNTDVGWKKLSGLSNLVHWKG